MAEGAPAAAKRPKLEAQAARAAARAKLHYSVQVPGKQVGRYIGIPDGGELADIHEEHEVDILDARDLKPEPSLDTHCFQLRLSPTKMVDFSDQNQIHKVYYSEMESIVKQATGAERVIVFDHTIRDTGSSGAGLNAKIGETAGAVIRVHTDYTDTSGPLRMKTLAESGGYTGVKLSKEELEDIMDREFCIVNVWRNIKEEPVQSQPLAVLDPSTLDRTDFLNYQMRYAERTGENYAMRFNPNHKWYFFPKMEKDECLVFKTWESRTDRPRYCFHTAFSDLNGPPGAPPRKSVEVRTVAILPRKS